MNPGYAGRTELPDNLKALFRPVRRGDDGARLRPPAPNAHLPVPPVIGPRSSLFSPRASARRAARATRWQLYKLCSEQLSQQDHYDYGMRAVKSVLVMAGELKRANPDLRRGRLC